jgi:DNA polymerase III alpha subunit (gram-positive type)
MLDNNQIYIVVDIETDGPIPGLHSMLSIGAVASTPEKETSSFYSRLLPHDDAVTDPDTMDWWNAHPEAWKEVNTDTESPEKVMRDFCSWMDDLSATPVFVASPIVFDFSFVSWYLHKFIGHDPFSDYSGIQRTLDLASFTAGKLNIPLNRSRRSQLDATLKAGMPNHSHLAIDDARGYGVILRNVLKA